MFEDDFEAYPPGSPAVWEVGGGAPIVTESTWAGFGVALRRLLREPRHARLFNGTMAFLLVASIVPMVL